jgi:hypothetical protein
MDDFNPPIFDCLNTVLIVWLSIVKPKPTFQKRPNSNSGLAMKKKMSGLLLHLIRKLAKTTV